ncbi:MAG TPA: glycosyltransferase family 87 protein [Gemmataceae bacterium]|nr:glycosyltransferase family 87 protein [Gemmataceae bacterium]
MREDPSTRPTRELSAVALAAVGLAVAAALAPALFVPCDFVAFWSSAKLFTVGEDPYDPALLLALENDAGFQTDRAVVIFNPPWAVVPIAALAGLPVRIAFAVWLGLQFGLMLVAGGLLWRSSGGSAERTWLSAVLTVGFAPTYILLVGGQLTGFALFGLAGFVAARSAGRPLLAGCLGALTALKPHLFGLFALALLIDAVRSRDGRKSVLAGAVVLAAASLLAVAVRPGVFDDYRASLTSPGTDTRKGLADYPAPVLGVMLRDAMPGRPLAAQFVPFALAAVGLVACRRWLPPGDRWAGVAPFLVAGSLVVAPYGAWWYDMVLLLPLVLLAAARLERVGNPRIAWAGVAAFATASLGLQFLYAGRDHLTPLFALAPPVVTLGCLGLIRAARSPSPTPAPVGA